MLGGAILSQHLIDHIGLMRVTDVGQLGKYALLLAAQDVSVGMVPVRHLQSLVYLFAQFIGISSHSWPIILSKPSAETAVVSEKSGDGKTAEVKALLYKYDAGKLSGVKPEDYAALLEEARKL